MDKKEFWEKISNKELLAELGRRLQAGRLAQKNFNKTMKRLAQKNFNKTMKRLAAEGRIKVSEEIINKRIVEFTDLSIQARNALRDGRGAPILETFADVKECTRKQLGERRRVGPKILDEVELWLAKYGYQLPPA